MTTQIALAALDGIGLPIILRADQNTDNSIALRTSLEAGGLAVGTAANPLVTADANDAAFQGVISITPSTPVVAARSLGYVCTTSGNVTLTLADGSAITLALTASTSFQTLPFAVTDVTLAGAAGTFWNLK